jgi:hypothetical protein
VSALIGAARVLRASLRFTQFPRKKDIISPVYRWIN